jgi:hypothetical protein
MCIFRKFEPLTLDDILEFVINYWISLFGTQCSSQANRTFYFNRVYYLISQKQICLVFGNVEPLTCTIRLISATNCSLDSKIGFNSWRFRTIVRQNLYLYFPEKYSPSNFTLLEISAANFGRFTGICYQLLNFPFRNSMQQSGKLDFLF